MRMHACMYLCKYVCVPEQKIQTNLCVGCVSTPKNDEPVSKTKSKLCGGHPTFTGTRRASLPSFCSPVCMCVCMHTYVDVVRVCLKQLSICVCSFALHDDVTCVKKTIYIYIYIYIYINTYM